MESTLAETPQQALARLEFEMAALGYITDARTDGPPASIVMSGKMRVGFWGWFWNIWILLFTFGLGVVWIFVQQMLKVRVTIKAVEENGEVKFYLNGSNQAVKDAQKVEGHNSS
jgi:hypothetical protein